MEISARESEVLSLVGEHLSNAEIATRLYISVRTVESHVSSLLRKLEVPDRRALARTAAEPSAAAAPRPVLPTPLTSFVGRSRERAELARALADHRQVTAVGPGGVGKTRLALTVAADVADAYTDGVWFVDLVATTEPDLVAAGVAAALGLGEQSGMSMADSVTAALAERRALLVLDNCEQVRDGVALFLERLLASCPDVTVLATSRAALLVPFERVYPVPSLSLSGTDEPDAIALFLQRAAAVGFRPEPDAHEVIASICGRLDGMALAIELAAARLPTLGLDGLAAGLSDPLRMLAGGSRSTQRHRSVRAALDWSHAMLDEADRTLLRRLSVFAAPFTAPAAAEVAGVDVPTAIDGLARLAEHSLLVVTAAATGTEYRALETIRQYGAERLDDVGETDDVRARHLRWCLAGLDDLAGSLPEGRDDVPFGFGEPLGRNAATSHEAEPDYRDSARPDGPSGTGTTSHGAGRTEAVAAAGRDPGPDGDVTGSSSVVEPHGHDIAATPSAGREPGWDDEASAASGGAFGREPATGDWRARFDAIADDCRASLAWAADTTATRPAAHRLARQLAELAFHRNLLGESQRQFARAAELAAESATAAAMLRQAAAVAGCRMRGDDMYRLLRSAAAAAEAAADPLGAATDLATAATVAFRFWSRFERIRPRDEALALIDDARRLLTGTDAHSAAAAIALAEAGVLSDAFGAAQGPPDNDVDETIARAERAVTLAHRTGDPLAESAALDALTGARSWKGDAFTVNDTARRRVTLLAEAPNGPATTHELVDALSTVTETSLGAGDLAGARQWARRLADHPMLAEVGDRATSWLLVADAFAGDVDSVLANSERFLESWRLSGRPARSAYGSAAASVVMVHSLRGDADAEREWRQVLRQVGTPPEYHYGYGAVFDATVLLHHGQFADAERRLAPGPDEVWKYITWIWAHWYVALRAESAVLADADDAAARIAEARGIVTGNPTAEAIVDRAEALLTGDRDRLLATAAVFDAAGSRYQSARTRVLAGGAAAEAGAAAIAALGLSPMAPVR